MVLLGDTYIPFVLNLIIMFLGLVLMGVVLLQRGKGGGLAGAFGGAGGSSAFGSRAGDQFTKVTLVVAAFWMFFIMVMTKTMPRPADSSNAAPPPIPAPADEGMRYWAPGGGDGPAAGRL